MIQYIKNILKKILNKKNQVYVPTVLRDKAGNVFVDGEPAEIYHTDIKEPLVFAGIDHVTKKGKLWYVVPYTFNILTLKEK
ncbi:MAG: hypothetical protein WC373_14340 [Smithella sp.]|jgi:MFS superfamily sulfate permease-like transporter